MKKIDGPGEPFLQQVAHLDKKSHEPILPQIEKDRVNISGKKKDALAADIEMISRMRKEGKVVSRMMPQSRTPVEDYASGFDISNSYTRETFKNCLSNTLQTTVSLEPDDTTFIITGDIPAMWVRDSCAQIHPYIPMCKNDPTLQKVIKGTILRHIKHFNSKEKDAPFINSWKNDYTPWEHKFEPDGIAYLIRLASLYSKTTGDTSWAHQSGEFDARKAFDKAIDLIKEKTGPSGMVQCPHRPSDDETIYPYNIPTNMFLAAMMPKLKELYLDVWKDPALSLIHI